VNRTNLSQYSRNVLLLWTRQQTFGMHRMQQNSWLCEEVSAARERLRCMEIVGWLFAWLIGRFSLFFFSLILCFFVSLFVYMFRYMFWVKYPFAPRHNRLNLRGDIYFYPLVHEICYDKVITAVTTKLNAFACVRTFRHNLLPPFSLFTLNMDVSGSCKMLMIMFQHMGRHISEFRSFFGNFFYEGHKIFIIQFSMP